MILCVRKSVRFTVVQVLVLSQLITPLAQAKAVGSSHEKAQEQAPVQAQAQVREQTRDAAGAGDVIEPIDSSSSLVIAPGFLLQLSSTQDQKLNGAFRVAKDGRVTLPYSVVLTAADNSIGEFSKKLSEAYRPYFRNTSHIQVSVREKRYWVDVLGLVGRPGSYLLKHESPLDELISSAGGLTEDLTAGFVRIQRKGKVRWVDLESYFKQGQLKDIPVWEGGELVFFQAEKPDAVEADLQSEPIRKVQVIGEVRNPGEITYRHGADGYYYLAKSGGPIASSDLDQVALIRTDFKTQEHRQLSLGPISQVKDIHDGDLMLVNAQKQTKFEHFLQTTSVITSIITAALLTVIAVREND